MIAFSDYLFKKLTKIKMNQIHITQPGINYLTSMLLAQF